MGRALAVCRRSVDSRPAPEPAGLVVIAVIGHRRNATGRSSDLRSPSPGSPSPGSSLRAGDHAVHAAVATATRAPDPARALETAIPTRTRAAPSASSTAGTAVACGRAASPGGGRCDPSRSWIDAGRASSSPTVPAPRSMRPIGARWCKLVDVTLATAATASPPSATAATTSATRRAVAAVADTTRVEST
jgi:hypothetical protein